MKSYLKFLINFSAGIIFAALIISFSTDTYQFKEIYNSFGAPFLILFGMLVGLAPFIPSWYSKPLWGFRKTPSGYKDTSIEKHPYWVVGLTLVIALSYGGIAFAGLKFSPRDALIAIGLMLYFLVTVVVAVLKRNRPSK